MHVTVGGILSGTWQTLRQRFWPLVGMYFVWFAIMMGLLIVLSIAMGGSMLALAGGTDDPEAIAGGLSAGFMALMAVFYLGYILVACGQYASLCTLASPLRRGEFGDAFQSGIRASPALLGVILLMLAAYFGAGMAVGAMAAAAASLGTAGAVVIALLVVPVALYLGARLGIVLPIVPVEGSNNPFRAIGRAWTLTRGNALPIFLSFLAFMVIMAVLFGIAVAPLFGTLSAMDDPNATPPIGAMAFLFIALMVVTVVITVAYSALLSTIHGQLAGGGSAAEAFE